jgi:hypothetical protein
LALQDEDPIITSLELKKSINFIWHQVYAVISLATSEDFDSTGNPLVNPENLTRGSKYQAPGTEGRTTDDTSTTV